MIQLRPSASHRWTKCAAAPRFALNVTEQPTGDPAREGTCAAWLAERALKNEIKTCADLIGTSHENGWLIEYEMASYVQDYVDHITRRGGEIDVERKVKLNQMIAGTPDAFAVLKDDVLYCDDLKFGFEIVHPYENTQISIYAGAVLRQFQKYERYISKVVLGVYQPRAYHPEGVYRTWEVYPEQLMKFVQWIELRGHDCQATDGNATPGAHCNHCPAAASCVALAHTVYKAFAVLKDERQGHLSSEELSHELDLIMIADKLIKARKNALTTEATARMKNSEHVPNWGFEERFGNPVFTVAGDVIKAMTGKNPYSDKLCTPAELIRRHANKDTVARMSTRPRIPPKLIKLERDHYEKIFKTEGK